MSIIINCPHCGNRPITEFAYGEVIEIPDTVEGDAARDIDRGFMRNNTEGVQTEAWFHTYGCRRWYYMRRDTRTNQFLEHPNE